MTESFVHVAMREYLKKEGYINDPSIEATVVDTL